MYSKSEVQSLVSGADNAHSVATITERNALTGLKVSDRVFVTNDGDSKWALYIVTAVTTGTGSTSTFVKIADEDIFTNAISASAIKSAYESNANTNVFTDAEKAKAGHITVTQAVNLDTMESGLVTTTTTANTALTNANAAASAASTAQSTANSANSAAAAAQSTANTAVTNAATAQTTANTAVSNANAAASAAATAQSTANTANAAAAAAQSTANTAVTNAATAQTTANNALSTANSKENAFTQETDFFTGLSGGGNTPVPVNLSRPIAPGFVPIVFFNGVAVKTVTFNPGESQITYTVPYSTEESDTIAVVFAYN